MRMPLIVPGLTASQLLLTAVTLVSFSRAVIGKITGPALSQPQQQIFRDRLFQTNLRGPRWSTYWFFFFRVIPKD